MLASLVCIFLGLSLLIHLFGALGGNDIALIYKNDPWVQNDFSPYFYEQSYHFKKSSLLRPVVHVINPLLPGGSQRDGVGLSNVRGSVDSLSYDVQHVYSHLYGESGPTVTELADPSAYSKRMKLLREKTRPFASLRRGKHSSGSPRSSSGHGRARATHGSRHHHSHGHRAPKRPQAMYTPDPDKDEPLTSFEVPPSSISVAPLDSSRKSLKDITVDLRSLLAKTKIQEKENQMKLPPVPPLLPSEVEEEEADISAFPLHGVMDGPSRRETTGTYSHGSVGHKRSETSENDSFVVANSYYSRDRQRDEGVDMDRMDRGELRRRYGSQQKMKMSVSPNYYELWKLYLANTFPFYSLFFGDAGTNYSTFQRHFALVLSFCFIIGWNAMYWWFSGDFLHFFLFAFLRKSKKH